MVSKTNSNNVPYFGCREYGQLLYNSDLQFKLTNLKSDIIIYQINGFIVKIVIFILNLSFEKEYFLFLSTEK
jgi:hypothetical protein